MSISFPTTDSASTLERIRATAAQNAERGKRATSQRRIEANRKNCRKSTGPKTIDGKRRSSRNAMKHGLCQTLSCLPSECEATFFTFVAELEAELLPATALQRLVFNQIASLTWRLERLPEAQTKLFAEELGKIEPEEDGGEALSPSDVLARRFSDEPGCNGFALMERYERGMRNQLLRLMRQFDQLRKHRPSTPHDLHEPPARSEQAWTPQKAAAQREWFAQQERLHAEGKEPDAQWVRVREIHLRQQAEEEAKLRSRDDGIASPMRFEPKTHERDAHATRNSRTRSGGDDGAGEERTQSKPSENLDSNAAAEKCSTAGTPPVTERSQPVDARDMDDATKSATSIPHPASISGAVLLRVARVFNPSIQN